jgi:hypothetical protein
MDAELRDYCNGIVYCLIRYGGLEEEEARRLVDESKLCQPQTEMDRKMLFHELHYYWAMHLLYGRDDPDNYWFRNSDLWPPPDDYYEWLKARSKSKAGQ